MKALLMRKDIFELKAAGFTETEELPVLVVPAAESLEKIRENPVLPWHPRSEEEKIQRAEAAGAQLRVIDVERYTDTPKFKEAIDAVTYETLVENMSYRQLVLSSAEWRRLDSDMDVTAIFDNCVFRKFIFSGDLSRTTFLNCSFENCRYSAETQWPKNFDPRDYLDLREV